ncbi:hypothetical protein HHX47_DHR4000906 [Lentinula edodes]|nr:hypothetical protein HHX47_DHR4000906 [Lentinula edodes]
MDADRIVEFDRLVALLENPNDHFRALVDQSHDRDYLIGIARRK